MSEDYQDKPVYICVECHEECTPIEETFDYAGSHCTHGKGGTHHTGNYVSDCCLADYRQEGYSA